MTKDEILDMPAGREMDILVAERVMGYNLFRFVNYPTREPFLLEMDKIKGSYRIPDYSTDISAAWKVVDVICIPAPEDCWTGPGVSLSKDGATGMWQVFFDYLDSLDGVHPNYNGAQTSAAEAETAPLAICRAALLAVLEVTE